MEARGRLRWFRERPLRPVRDMVDVKGSEDIGGRYSEVVGNMRVCLNSGRRVGD